MTLAGPPALPAWPYQINNNGHGDAVYAVSEMGPGVVLGQSVNEYGQSAHLVDCPGRGAVTVYFVDGPPPGSVEYLARQAIGDVDGTYEYSVIANSDEEKIFTDKITEMYWSRPLARMGRLGWELVGLNPQNTLVPGWLPGYVGTTAVPVRMVFFFKRPKAN